MTAAQEAPGLTFNLADPFEQVAEQVPDRVAIVIGDRRVTYAELDERSTRFANYLLSIGVQPGDTVGINSYNRIEWIEAMFGRAILKGAPARGQQRRRAFRRRR